MMLEHIQACVEDVIIDAAENSVDNYQSLDWSVINAALVKCRQHVREAYELGRNDR